MNKSVKKAGKLATVWITLATWMITLWFSIKAIITSLMAREPRKAVDKVTRQWSQALLNRVNMNIQVKGDFNTLYVEGRPCIVMCNHSSAYDIPVSFVSLPGSLRMLSKKELFKIPIFSRALTLCEFVSIDRHDKEQARLDLLKAKSKMEDGIILWVAPEGTRSKDGQLLPFKKGGFHLAIHTGAIVIPMVIKDIHKVLPTKTFQINLNSPVEVRLGEAIDAADYTIEQRQQLLERVESSMADLLAAPLACHDKVIMNESSDLERANS